MNCKLGDLAYIVDPEPGYSRRFVEIFEAIGPVFTSVDPGHHWWVRPQGWAPTDCELDSHGCFIFPDSRMRPIRGGDGQDQTLEWAGLPNKETA